VEERNQSIRKKEESETEKEERRRPLKISKSIKEISNCFSG